MQGCAAPSNAVIGIPPVDSPQAAVKVAIAAKGKTDEDYAVGKGD
jgi:hypothetical protein